MFNSVCYQNRTDSKTIPICVSCKVTNDYKHHDRKLFKSNGMQINVQYINGFNFYAKFYIFCKLDKNTMQSILIDIAILSSLWLYTVGIQKIIHHRCIQVHTVSKQTERLIWLNMAFWEALFHSFWSVSGYASTSLRSFIYAHDLWSVCDDTLWQVLPNGVLRNHWRCLEAFDVTFRVHDFRLWCCLLVLRLRVELWSHPVFHSVFLHFR